VPGLSDCVKCGWSLCQVQRWFAQGSQQLCARRGRSLRQVHCWFAPGVAGICARFTAGLCQVWPEFAPGSLQVCARCAKSPETGYAYRPSAHFSVPGQRKNADRAQKVLAPGTKNTCTGQKKLNKPPICAKCGRSLRQVPCRSVPGVQNHWGPGTHIGLLRILACQDREKTQTRHKKHLLPAQKTPAPGTKNTCTRHKSTCTRHKKALVPGTSLGTWQDGP